MRASAPSRRAILATARPWLPSVAVTKVSPVWGNRCRSSSRSTAGSFAPARALSSRFTAQDAPSTLNAGEPALISKLSRDGQHVQQQAGEQ